MSDDFKFQDDWTADVEKAVKGWLSDTYRKWENEEPDQEFLEYITVMIKNEKTVGEIRSELIELGTDETRANEFVAEMAAMLKKLTPAAADKESKPTTTASPPTATPITSTSSTSRPALDAPLKTGREYAPKKDLPAQAQTSDGGAHRLLNSALQTSRTGNSTSRNSDQHGAAGSRGGYKRQDGRQEFGDQQQKRFRTQDAPPLPPTPAPAPSRLPSESLDPVAYFEEMNRIAIQSGFKNAQEMLNSQKELIALMKGQDGTAAGNPARPPPPAYPPTYPAASAYPPVYEAYYPPQQPYGGHFAPPPPPGYYPGSFAAAPYPHQGAGGRGGGFRAGRAAGGRGRFSGRQTTNPPPAAEGAEKTTEASATATASSGAEQNAAAEGTAKTGEKAAVAAASAPAALPTSRGPTDGRLGGRGGRGRGRGPPPHIDPTAAAAASVPAVQNPFAVASGAASSAPLLPNAAAQVGYGGSGAYPSFGGRGRGRGGRTSTPMAGGHKTWVNPNLVQNSSSS